MRTIKIGEKENNYLEFKRNENNISLETVDKDGHKSLFIIEEEQLEIIYRYMIGENDGNSE